MCFSSAITVEDIAAKMRDMNVVMACGEILRKAIKKVDFKLEDTFCDGNELKESWESTQLPEQLLTFFSSLFGIKRSSMLKCEATNMKSDEEIFEEEEDDSSAGESMQDFEQVSCTKQNQLNCLFQIIMSDQIMIRSCLQL